MKLSLYFLPAIVMVISACNQISGINDLTFDKGDTDNNSDTATATETDSATSSDSTGTDTNTEDSSSGTDIDTSSDTGVDTNTDTNNCGTGGPLSWECNSDGNAAGYDNCDELQETIECAQANGLCQNGICGCTSGWTGENCDLCLRYVTADGDTTGTIDGQTWTTAYQDLNVAMIAAAESACSV